MIEARIIADSISKYGGRLTTFVCTYPRFIHCEVMTHRVFSRNAASSRAIPVKKMIDRIKAEPAKPISWGKNQKGMQAGEEISERERTAADFLWRAAMYDAVYSAQRLLDLGVHKQIANRLLEPFAHMTTIITASRWGNFFNLRAHKDAQPEFQELAFAMLKAYQVSEPAWKTDGGWHLPFGDRMPEGLTQEQQIKIAVARCARVSYLTFEGDIDPGKDYDLHDSLLQSGHMSPFEHCAFVHPESPPSNFHGGWYQYRKLFPGEERTAFEPQTLLLAGGHR